MTTHDENRPAHAVRPPLWAELALRLLLQPEDAETVSGDLLEEYRDTIYPSRGRWRANLWFVRQVADFAWRGTAVWGLLVGLTAPTSFPVFTAWSVPLPAICLLLLRRVGGPGEPARCQEAHWLAVRSVRSPPSSQSQSY